MVFRAAQIIFITSRFRCYLLRFWWQLLKVSAFQFLWGQHHIWWNDHGVVFFRVFEAFCRCVLREVFAVACFQSKENQVYGSILVIVILLGCDGLPFHTASPSCR